MYVRDLEPGLLIRPAENYRWSVDPLYRNINGSEAGVDELNESGIHHHATPRFVSPAYRDLSGPERKVAVYLGVKHLQMHYFGVKKQHMVLIDGTVAVIDGYQFREIEKV